MEREEGKTKSEAPTRTGKFPDFRLGDFVKNWQDIGNGNLALGNPKNIQINNGTITKKNKIKLNLKTTLFHF